MDCTKQYGKIPAKQIPTVLKDIQKFCTLLRGNKVKDSKEAFLSLPLVVQCLFLHHGWDILSKGENQDNKDAYLTALYLFKLFRGKDMKESPTYNKYTKKTTLEKIYKSALYWNRERSPGKSKVPGITIEDYTEKSIVVRGEDTKEIKEKLQELNGKYNPNLEGGPGWIFSKKRREEVEDLIKSVKPVKSTVPKAGKKKYDKEYQKYEAPPGEIDPLYIYYTSLYTQNSKSRLAVTWLTEHGVYEGGLRDKLIKKYKELADQGKLIR